MAFTFGAPAATPSLFGQPAAAAPSQSGASSFSFGHAQQQQQQQQPGLFSMTNPQPQPPNPLAHSQQQQLPSPYSNLGPKTKFGDLPDDDIKKFLVEVATIIRDAEEKYASVVTSRTPTDLSKLHHDRAELHKTLSALRTLLLSDLRSASALRERTAKAYRRAEQAGRFADRFGGDPQRQAQAVRMGLGGGEFTIEYFQDLAVSFEERIQGIRQAVEDLERTASSASRAAAIDPRISLQDSLRAQHESLVALASRAAAVHDAVRRGADEYARWRQRRMREDVRGVGGGPDVNPTDLHSFARFVPAPGTAPTGSLYSSTAAQAGSAFGNSLSGNAGGAGGSLFGQQQGGFGQQAGGGLFGQSAVGGTLFGGGGGKKTKR